MLEMVKNSQTRTEMEITPGRTINKPVTKFARQRAKGLLFHAASLRLYQSLLKAKRRESSRTNDFLRASFCVVPRRYKSSGRAGAKPHE